MKHFLNIISALIKGGIFFLLPIILLIVLLERAIHLIQPLSHQIQSFLGIENNRFFTPFLVSLLLVLFICLIAGYIAQRGLGKRMIEWIEDHILVLFPGYKLMKTTFEQRAGIAQNHNFPVVLVPIDGWMMAFLVEELEDEKVLVFVPGSPETWSGNLIIFDKTKIKKTDLTQHEVHKIGRSLGISSFETLKGKIKI